MINPLAQTTALALVPGETVTSLTDQDWTIAVHRANWMHQQIEATSRKLISLEQRRWTTAVVLGGLLSRMKANSPHGSWHKLFASNSAHVQNFSFSQNTAGRYMKLHKEVLKRAKRLKDVDIALIESGQRDERALAEISKLSSAETLRQAYLDFGVSKTPREKEPFGGKRNENGGPRKEDQPEVSPAERLDAERKAADDAISEICTNLARFRAQGRLPLVSSQKLSAAKTLFAEIIDDILNIKYSD